MSIRRILVIPLIALGLAGCDARSTAGLPDGSIVAGGYGDKFYAEIPKDEGGSKRVYLFRTVAGFDAFVATGAVNELANKRYIAQGANRETLIVEAPKGEAGMPDSLVADYRTRHGL
jgi:hypothetical protein